MSRNIVETVIGAVVIAVAGGFLAFAYNSSDVKAVNGYQVGAIFDDVGGVGVGSDVRIGGIKVGVIDGVTIDPQSYRAKLTFQVKDEIKLPKDTTASISSSGLLGGKFVKLEPGGDDRIMSDGDVITFTQSSVSLEEMIGKFVFSGGGVEGEDEAPAAQKSDEKEAKAPAVKDSMFSLGIE